MSKKFSVNISKASSAIGLKEKIQKEASSRGLTLSKLVSGIYEYAIYNRSSFKEKVKNPGDKPGLHISTSVSRKVRDGLNEWAAETGRQRTLLCVFILEKVIEDDLFEKIFVEESKKGGKIYKLKTGTDTQTDSEGGGNIT